MTNDTKENDKIGKLVSLIKGGNKDMELDLINSLEGLIVNSIKGYCTTDNKAEFEDLYQDACEEILKGIYEYNENLDIHFLGYMQAKLHFKFLYKNRSLKYNKLVDSLNLKISEESKKEKIDFLKDKKSNVEDIYIKNDIYIKLYKSIDKLELRQKKIINLHYFENYTLKDISKILNISYKTCKREKNKALNILKIKM